MKVLRLLTVVILFSNQIWAQEVEFCNPVAGHTALVNDLHFASETNEFVTVSDDMSLCIWDFKTNKLIRKRFLNSSGEGKLNAVKFSSTGRYIYLGGHLKAENGLYPLLCYDRKLDNIVPIVYHKMPITSIDLATNGKILVAGSLDSSISINTLLRGDSCKTERINCKNAIKNISLSPDNQKLAIVWQHSSYWTMMNLQGAEQKDIQKHFHDVNVVKFSPDTNYIVSAANDYLICLYTNTGKYVKTLHKMKHPVVNLDFAYDSRLFVASTLMAGEIDCISMPDGGIVGRFIEFDNSVKAISFTPSSATGVYDIVACGGNNSELKVINPISGRVLSSYSKTGAVPLSIKFTENDKFVFSFKPQDKFYKYELDLNKMVLNKSNLSQQITQSISKNNCVKYKSVNYCNNQQDDGRLTCYASNDSNGIVIGSDKNFRYYNNGKQLFTSKIHKGTIRSIAMNAQGTILATSAEDQITYFWKINKQQIDTLPFMSLFVTEQGDWLCWTKEGYFTGSEKSDSYLAWFLKKTKNGDFSYLMKQYEASSFSDVLYRPDLLVQYFETKLSMKEVVKKNNESLVDIAKLERASPPEFMEPFAFAGNVRRGLAEKSTDVYVIDTTEVTISVAVKYGGGGISELDLFQNDKLIIADKDFAMQNFKDKVVKEYKVRLLPGKNSFKVYTLNSKKAKSMDDRLTIECKANSTPITDLYLLTIGLNEYENNRMNLNYGVPDAKAIASELRSKGGNIFANTYVYELYNKDATLMNIKKAIDEIKEKSKLSDMLVIYYAGHGVVYTPEDKDEGEFYMVLHDVINLSSAMITEKALSSSLLRQWLSEINAQKQLVLMDACHSEASFASAGSFARRGLAEQQAIYQLARSSGTAFIAACGSNQTAKEFTQLGHGAFTTALIEAFSGKADGGNKDKKITVSEIKAYIEDRVPELTEKYSGSAQYPSSYSIGQDFPVVVY